jgi:hypothetical protein
MEDNSPTPKIHLPRENIFIQTYDDPPKIKHLLNVYFTINFIHLIHKTCQMLSTSTNQCQCLHLHSHCCENLKHYSGNTTYCCWLCLSSVFRIRNCDSGVNIFLPLFFNHMNLCMSLMCYNLWPFSTDHCTVVSWRILRCAESKMFIFLDMTLL